MQEDYNHTQEEAKKIAAEAFSRLDRENLPASPDLFELFYNYYSGAHSEIVRSIDIMVSQNFELTLERCKELHKRNLRSDKSSETLAKAEQIVGETLTDVDEMFDSVKASNADVTGSMDSINGDLSNAVEPDQLKNIIVNIMSEAQKMVSENQSLEQKLEKSSSKMQELKTEMETVREEAYTDSLTILNHLMMPMATRLGIRFCALWPDHYKKALKAKI